MTTYRTFLGAFIVLVGLNFFANAEGLSDSTKNSLISFGAKAKEKVLVNLNTANAAELAKLPGIGPQFAQAIIDARPYKNVDDLKKVKGLKESVIAKIKGLVTTK